MAVDLLQSIGLTQYEAEAYYTLLREGPLTGYELGKRSKVPLPRAYDVLARLCNRGLTLVQPGEPPHYLAVVIDEVLQSTRMEMEATLSQLSHLLRRLPRHEENVGFWVIHGEVNVRRRCQTMIQDAHQQVMFFGPSLRSDLHDVIEGARERGLRITTPTVVTEWDQWDMILLLVDDGEALLAAGATVDGQEALVSRNPALLEIVRWYFQATEKRAFMTEAPAMASAASGGASDWLAWEEAKQRRLRRSASANGDAA